jgi:hypothetical protein
MLHNWLNNRLDSKIFGQFLPDAFDIYFANFIPDTKDAGVPGDRMKPQKQPMLPTFVEKVIVGKVWEKIPPERQILSGEKLLCNALNCAFAVLEANVKEVKGIHVGSCYHNEMVYCVVVSRERFSDMVAWNLMEDGTIFGVKVFIDSRIPASTAIVCSKLDGGSFAKVEVIPACRAMTMSPV